MKSDLPKDIERQLEIAERAAAFRLKKEQAEEHSRTGQATNLGSDFEAFGATLAEMQKLELERDRDTGRTSSAPRRLPHRDLFAALFDAPEQPAQWRLDKLMALMEATNDYALQHLPPDGIHLDHKGHKAKEFYCALEQLVTIGLEAHCAFTHAAASLPSGEREALMQTCVTQAQAGYATEMAKKVDPAAQLLADMQRRGYGNPPASVAASKSRGPDIAQPAATKAEQMAAATLAKARSKWGLNP